MPTVSRDLPDRPHLDIPKKQARELLARFRAADPDALARIRRLHPKFHEASDKAIAASAFRLADAQLVIAREYGLGSWPVLKKRIQSATIADLLDAAICRDDRDATLHILRENPELLHIPVVSGNWGPPMSHATNLGRLEIVKAIHALGARDHQHAFDRAILQSKLECARWLLQNGATLAPGLVMGPCETLSVAGLQFLHELNAPFTNGKGDPLAPLALVLETYARNPPAKHEILKIFARRGYKLSNTPIMAFHLGDTARLAEFLQRDPSLVHRRFTTLEIYPPELGCDPLGRSGMCGTPLEGSTLLHLAIDFDETEIFDLLLKHGADVNAGTSIDSEGFGGHTPFYNVLISGSTAAARRQDGTMAEKLLQRGASTTVRANVRKFLDWRETPGWHVVKNATPAEWAQTFPEQSWVNQRALKLIL